MAFYSVSIANPTWLWALAALPAMAILAGWARGRRLRDWKRLGQDGRLRPEPSWIWTLALGCLIVALARPQWGDLPGGKMAPGHDLVVAVDVSRSMGAEDAVPDRLGVAVDSVVDLLRAAGREPSERVAVVAFAGRGVLRCPLTENLGAAIDAVRALRPGSVTPGGTDLAAALEASLAAFDEEFPEPEDGRSIVLISDGEDHPRLWERALPELKRLRVVVHTVAVGDPDEGHELPLPRAGKGGAPRVVTYRGEPVRSSRRDDALRAISEATGGAFIPLGLKPADLGSLYVEKIAPEARRRRDSAKPPERTDRFPMFLAMSLVLSLGASRPRWRRHRFFLAILLGLSLGAAPAPGARDVREVIQAGETAYLRGDYRAALLAFETAVGRAPDDPIPRYDAAATLYRLGRFDEATSRYREARERAGETLRTKIDYALGNAAVAGGHFREALGHYDSCLNSKAAGDGLDEVRRDAALNRRFAEQRIPPNPEETEPQDEPSRPGAQSSSDGPEGGSEPSDGASPPPGGPDQGGEDSPPEGGGNQSVGGGGGSGSESPAPGTPEAKLADALGNIREAQGRRQPPQASETADDPDLKDW